MRCVRAITSARAPRCNKRLVSPVCSVEQAQSWQPLPVRHGGGRFERNRAAARREGLESMGRDAIGEHGAEDREHVMHPWALVPECWMSCVVAAWRAPSARDGSHEVVRVVPGVPSSRAMGRRMAVVMASSPRKRVMRSANTLSLFGCGITPPYAAPYTRSQVEVGSISCERCGTARPAAYHQWAMAMLPLDREDSREVRSQHPFKDLPCAPYASHSLWPARHVRHQPASR